MRLRTKALAVATIAAATLIGTTTAADAARPAVPVHVVTTYRVHVATTIQPGRVRFHNTGVLPVMVVKKRHAGIKRLVKDLNAGPLGLPPNRLSHDFTLVDVIDGRSSVYLPLTRATYYFTNVMLAHYKAADVRTVTVQGKTKNAAAPASRDLVVHPGRTLTAPATLGRTRYLHVQNHTVHVQDISYFGLSADVSIEQIDDFLAAPSFEKLLNLEFSDFGDIALLAGHSNLWAHGPHRPGRYLIMTMGVTSKLPTLTKGSVRLLTVR